MIGHPHRQLARTIAKATKTGTPIRLARGVVVSSTIGQTQVTLDGGATSVPAFNYGHTTNLPVGTVVDTLAVGRKAYVLGAYGAVPVGGLIATATGPGSTTNFSASATVCSVAAAVTAGCTYEVSGTMAGGTQNTSTGIAVCLLTTDDSILSERVLSSTLAAGVESAGSGTWLYTPASSRTTTFKMLCSTSAGTFTITAASANVIVTRRT